MKSIIYFLSSLSIVSLGFSCTTEKGDPIGRWSDNIKLSKKSVEFDAQADSVIIKTEGDWWWIEGIRLNDSIYQYYHRSDINLESDRYTIKEEEFVVERRDKNTLFIKMEENSAEEPRLLDITVEAGNYFDYVVIKQAGIIKQQ